MTFPISIHLLRRCLGLALACALAACAPELKIPAPDRHGQAPADFPQAYYLQAQASGKKLLRIDAAKSLVAIEVHRGGTLARLGHDHVVASRDVAGYVLPEEDRADLYVPLDLLSVDEPALRAEAGFAPQPPPSAIAGTRRNMLDKVLETERFPFALIHVKRNSAAPSNLTVTITLHGQVRTYDIAAQMKTDSTGFMIEGRMHLNQSDFGITPFSVLGGALQVEDRLDFRFDIRARESN